MEYSAKIISELFWLQESRKTAGYLLKGYDKAAIRKIAWNENIYQVKAEYRAYDVLNGTYRRIAELPEVVLKTFTSCDVETAKILNLIAILMDSRVFLNFFMKSIAKKFVWGGRKSQIDIFLFFFLGNHPKRSLQQLERGDGRRATRRMGQVLCFAGLLVSRARTIKPPPIYTLSHRRDTPKAFGLGDYLGGRVEGR